MKSWLKNLYDNGCVGRIYSRTIDDGNKPAIYYLNLKSRNILKNRERINAKLLNRVYREKLRSKVFIEHCLFIADIYLHLVASTDTQKVKLQFFTQTDLYGVDYLLNPLPTAYIVIINSKLTHRYFLEVIEEGVPRFVLRSRIRQYIEYHEEGTWETNTNHPFPRVLTVCPNIQTLTYLKRLILRSLEEEGETDISFYLTTKLKIIINGVKKEIWQKVEPNSA